MGGDQHFGWLGEHLKDQVPDRDAKKKYDTKVALQLIHTGGMGVLKTITDTVLFSKLIS